MPIRLESGDEEGAQKAKYVCIAVIVHEGKSLEFGHYISFNRNDGRDIRCSCSDHIVRPATKNEVLGSSPYVLVYERCVDNNRAGERKREEDEEEEPYWNIVSQDRQAERRRSLGTPCSRNGKLTFVRRQRMVIQRQSSKLNETSQLVDPSVKILFV